MASRKFRFVSPGVFLKEIDNSQLPGIPEGIGPVIIGRTRKGPAMKPYKVASLDELERVFGKPMPGNQGEDPWRDGTDILAESYAPYAAHAYLSADISSPVTMVRLAGIAGEDADGTTNSEPGWAAESAYGLFLFESGSTTLANPSLELGAIFYGATSTFIPKLKGAAHCSGSVDTVITAEPGTAVKFSGSGRLTLDLTDGTKNREISFLLSEMRDDFNTNPVATNQIISTAISGTLSHAYWLGETFENAHKRFESNLTESTGGSKSAIILKLGDLMSDFKSTLHPATSARTGWVVGQDTSGDNSVFDIDNQQKLFRLIALHEGLESSRGLIIGIEDVKIPRPNSTNKFGSFSVVVRRIGVTGLDDIERFDNCNLDPASENFISKKIGDQYVEWSPSDKRNKLYGSNPNISEYIRVDLKEDILTQGGPTNNAHVPFGYYGPIKPKSITGPLAAGTGILADNQWIDNKASLHVKEPDSGTGLYTLSWPSMPHVVTGSSEDSYYMGATPYKLIHASSSNTVGSTIDRGYVDFVRRASSFGVLSAHQDSGVADNVSTEYSYKFSMDEVVLVPNPGVTVDNIESASNVKSAYYQPGSKPAQYIKAKAVDKIFAGSTAGENIKITVPVLAGGLGTEVVLVPTAAAGMGSSVDAGHIHVQFSGEANTNKITLAAAINGSGDATFNPAKVKYGPGLNATTGVPGITASDGTAANKITLTAAKPGAAGNLISGVNTAGAQWKDDPAFTGGEHSNSAEQSFSAHAAVSGSVSLRTLANIVEGFHMPLVGGFDGVDITEADPFNARVLTDATTANNYAYASIDRAIELVRDPEALEHNLALMPGITNASLTTKLVNTCEARADSMAIIDLPDVYIPPFQKSCDNFKERVSATTPEKSAAALVNRQLNSSYAATYYPWVKIKDEQFNRDVWVPPSVVALGVMAYTEQRDEVWFAPAGFNRGGLNQGNAGLPVLQVSEQLLSKDRDTLYDANINPVASFVSEGIVIFGQKTLQTTQSALDRINVRRLLIFIKKEVSRISNRLLFEQNVQATWNRFINQVVPFLESVKVRFGLSDFRVVLDSTTTTPDLVDRNIMYAKIFLKPARSIEFIAVDFVITNTGASFAD